MQVRSSLHFGSASQGEALALYYVGAAVASVPAGRLAERVSGVRVMRGVAVLSVAVLVAFAVLARGLVSLAGLLFVSGVLSGSMQPALNLFLARRVPASRQGMAFGVKQAAVPFASTLAGLAVPAIGVTLGWRWAFVVAGTVACAAVAAVPAPATSLAAYRVGRPAHKKVPALAPLLVLACGFSLGVLAASALGAFLVSSLVAARVARGTAGLVAALASGVALCTRVTTGIRADRRGGRHFPVVAAMLAFGGLGYVLLAAGAAEHIAWLLVIGALFAGGIGWGWNGLFNFAVVRTHSEAPAGASSVVQVGGRLGGMTGPFVVGLVVAHASYADAWIVCAVATVVGALAILAGRRMLVASRA